MTCKDCGAYDHGFCDRLGRFTEPDEVCQKRTEMTEIKPPTELIDKQTMVDTVVKYFLDGGISAVQYQDLVKMIVGIPAACRPEECMEVDDGK